MKVELIIVAIIVVLVGGGLFVILSGGGDMEATRESFNRELGITKQPYVEIANPSGFVNTDDKPIKIADYVGKQVILLDIMTYSCINCQRTFPYVTAWYEKYKDDGLIVIGIHTPEFAFEKDKVNVEKAMQEFGINFPVVLDNDYGTWRALKNTYWPRKYLIDIHGNIVYDHIGEGAYDETEKKIQELLEERKEVLGIEGGVDTNLAVDAIDKVEIAARSPETYFGSARNEYLGNGRKNYIGEQTLTIPEVTKANLLYLGGTWSFFDEFAGATKDSVVRYKYNAKQVYLVADSLEGGVIEVWQDGQKVKDLSVKESRLYDIMDNESPGEHTLELRVSPGIRLYAFTFG